MGAANIARAYQLYAGKIPPLSFQALCYMALVALDRDAEPQYWEGWEALVTNGLGRDKADASAMKAFERVTGDLFRAGAITTVRRSSARHGHVITARYRLWLDEPAPPGKRGVRPPARDAQCPPENGGQKAPGKPREGRPAEPPSGQSVPPGFRGVDNPAATLQCPPENGGLKDLVPPEFRPGAPRIPSWCPPNSVLVPPGKRGAKEEERSTEEEKQEREPPKTALDLTDRGKHAGGREIKIGSSSPRTRQETEAARLAAADALTAWQLRQQSRPADSGATVYQFPEARSA